MSLDSFVHIVPSGAPCRVAILCALAFGVRVDPSSIETRSACTIAAADFDRARSRGETIRQIAYAEYDAARGTLTAWVAPMAVPDGSIFARTVGPRNAAVITGRYAGEMAIAGAGAGGDATAVAVIGDIVTIARDRAAIVPAPQLSAPRAIVGLPSSELRIPNSEFLLPTSAFAEAV